MIANLTDLKLHLISMGAKFSDDWIKDIEQALSRSEVGEVDPIEEAHKRSEAYKYDKSKYPVMPSGKAPAPDVTEDLKNDLRLYGQSFEKDGERIDPKDVYMIPTPDFEALVRGITDILYKSLPTPTNPYDAVAIKIADHLQSQGYLNQPPKDKADDELLGEG